jgi:hypothetical protein
VRSKVGFSTLIQVTAGSASRKTLRIIALEPL